MHIDISYAAVFLNFRYLFKLKDTYDVCVIIWLSSLFNYQQLVNLLYSNATEHIYINIIQFYRNYIYCTANQKAIL